MERLGLVGHPVGHSMSQVMHNTVFEKLGLDYSYELFDVKTGELEDFVGECRTGFSGLNVTIPHKVAVSELLDELSREAKLIGAVNTIKFEGSHAMGFNTDGIGFVRSVEEAGVNVSGKGILVLGAGGAARAICFQSIIEGGHVSLSNRSEEKHMAVELAGEIEDKTGETVEVVDMEPGALKKALEDVDVLVNATPVGMHPNTDNCVIDVELIPDGVTVVDIVYNPVETMLLKKAVERGLTTVSGVGMLVHQGAESERIWLDIDPPVDVMRDAVLARLASEH